MKLQSDAKTDINLQFVTFFGKIFFPKNPKNISVSSKSPEYSDTSLKPPVETKNTIHKLGHRTGSQGGRGHNQESRQPRASG